MQAIPNYDDIMRLFQETALELRELKERQNQTDQEKRKNTLIPCACVARTSRHMLSYSLTEKCHN
jgi:hypothetical protein